MKDKEKTTTTTTTTTTEREREETSRGYVKSFSLARFLVFFQVFSLSLLFFVREPLFSSSVGFLTKQTEEGFG